jgi:hypothetical protein
MDIGIYIASITGIFEGNCMSSTIGIDSGVYIVSTVWLHTGYCKANTIGMYGGDYKASIMLVGMDRGV